MLCDMMEEVIPGMGQQHVIQMVNNNATKYVVDSRLFF